jgi:hypothetical protein
MQTSLRAGLKPFAWARLGYPYPIGDFPETEMACWAVVGCLGVRFPDEY